jgi:hypothetical protein
LASSISTSGHSGSKTMRDEIDLLVFLAASLAESRPAGMSSQGRTSAPCPASCLSSRTLLRRGSDGLRLLSASGTAGSKPFRCRQIRGRPGSRAG